MTEPSRRTRGVQHGPRSRQVVEAVRAATLAELARAGFTGVTMDGVARAAGVNRTTLYRRWPTKAALLADVVEPLLARYDADPGTGSLRGDLLALMTAIRDNAARPEGRALIAAATTGAPELGELVRAANARTLAPFHRALARAGERGELEGLGDAEVIAHLVFHGVVMWEQAHGAPPGDVDLDRILGALLPGRG
ncbi:TetR/AcrR family transcriptional regulator [Actinosynnema mirum]|uniref:Transcriptional regulator, TetR family n=1 Tax=Actinosynnema mirum (strain ATCC 29888 / DSM 43827 / JCM 3225 / NBRC 14064 / NCIMB 13271 / NRRL B-12336 / IMRU 3971 / 101) TaxID=446462 RepID=C6WMU0_ACTMD|nr:TetR/AcrR family transcriptional regulator [Actinosynnema mirum]ACU38453.1 transcriptional regulator, TetR family [Actinosynnema mirum DSM 43827]